jgi:hypothetical protein
MALSADIKTVRYGTPDGHQVLNRGLASNQTVYRGSVALQDASTGRLKSAASPGSTDIVLGIVAQGGPGVVDSGAGIVNGSTAGATTVDIDTGTFILASGTGADALSLTTNSKTVYLIDESTVGATSNGAARPVAGIQMADPTTDPSIPTGFVAVKLGTPSSPLGGP